MTDELELPKPGPTNPDEQEDSEVEEEETEDEQLTEDEEEEQARAELGEVCENCGEEFTEANGKPALCADCFAVAEDIGEKDHAPLSKHPVITA